MEFVEPTEEDVLRAHLRCFDAAVAALEGLNKGNVGDVTVCVENALRAFQAVATEIKVLDKELTAGADRMSEPLFGLMDAPRIVAAAMYSVVMGVKAHPYWLGTAWASGFGLACAAIESLNQVQSILTLDPSDTLYVSRKTAGYALGAVNF